MKERLIRFFSSYKAAILLMVIYAVLMAVATIVEKHYTTEVAKALIYYSPLFILLHLLLVLNFVGVTVSRKLFLRQKWGYVLVHTAFIVVMAGAMVTHVFGQDGMMSLREGEKTNVVLVRKGDTYIEHYLPFEVELLDFHLKRYPGSNSPSSYESLLKFYVDGENFQEKIYMNHVKDLKGYRFFQASYDPDEMGSILSVSHDVVGRNITYTGYALLLIGLIGCFVSRGSRFRRLLARLKAQNLTVALLLVSGLGLLSSLPAQAVNIPQAHAQRFGHLPMQDVHGRIVPVNTFASQIVRKFEMKEFIQGLSEDQILLNMLIDPTVWANKPLVLVEDVDLRERFTSGRELISYRDAFDEVGDYRYSAEVEKAYLKSPALRSRVDKELLKLDEKINLLHQLFNFQMIRIFPVPGDSLNHRWIAAGDDFSVLTKSASDEVLRLFNSYRRAVMVASRSGNWASADAALEAIVAYQKANLSGLALDEDRLDAEVDFNRRNLVTACRKGYLILGGMLLILAFAGWFRDPEKVKEENSLYKLVHILRVALTIGVYVAFAGHLYAMILRGYISGHAPWSNSYETMVLLSWTAVLGGLLFRRKSFTAFALSTLFGGVVLFVSGLNWMDPEITPLVPVLKSPWLMSHVASLMTSYGFLGIACMLSTTNLLAFIFMNENNWMRIRPRIYQLSIITELALMIGLALMIIGIFIGAVWANESWGRYWSWDPKETWALITAVVYAVVLHLRWFENGPADSSLHLFRFSLLSQLAFLSVLMTYLGVNYLLSGMHSYGNTSGLSGLPWWVYAAIVGFFVLPGVLAFIRLSRSKYSK